MKKVFLGALVFGALALTSCKKDYTCTIGEGDTKVVKEYNDLDKDEAEKREKECEEEFPEGVWSVD